MDQLVVFWDNIFVGWLNEFYRPMGIDVEHRPESDKPLSFVRLPTYTGADGPEVRDLKKLNIGAEMKGTINSRGEKELVSLYIDSRLEELYSNLEIYTS